MWARIVEVLLGMWLALSPFIFHAAEPPSAVVYADFVGGAVICTIALAAYWPQSRKLHLLNGIAGIAFVVFAFVSDAPPPPYHQNHVVLGLLIVMTSVVPNRTGEPPRRWLEYYNEDA